MYFQLIFGLSVLCLWATAFPCHCNLGNGTNVCGSGAPCYPVVVRPAPCINVPTPSKPRVICRTIGGVKPLQPVIGLCSCGQTIVTPARNPPVCDCCGGSSSSSSSSSHSSQCESSSSSSSSSSSISYGGLPIQDTSALAQTPADPVSLAIAYKQQISGKNIPRNSVADRDIAFGFRKLPIELTSTQRKKAIAEESLSKINGEILELKLAPCAQQSVDEEAIEELIAEEEEEAQEGGEIKSPSLADLGFVSAKAPCGKFIDLEIVKEPIGCGVEPVPECNDCYRPGQVILKEGRSVPLAYPIRSREPLCLDEAEAESEDRNLPAFAYASSHSSSSSNKAHTNVIFKKLACPCGKY